MLFPSYFVLLSLHLRNNLLFFRNYFNSQVIFLSIQAMKKVIIQNETIITVITYEPMKHESNWKSTSSQSYCLNDKRDNSFINFRWTICGFYNNTDRFYS